MTNNTSSEDIQSLFQSNDRILIVSHIRPDGDAIGSALGLGMALRKKGKQVTVALADGLPSNFRHLPGSKTMVNAINPDQQFDLVISVDASDLERLGNVVNGRAIDLQIDHHVTNLFFADHNFVEETAVATCAILAENFPNWGLEFDPDIATLLLTGILTDTIGFRTSNVTSKALRIAADLMDAGADLPGIYYQNLISRSYEQVNYWGFALQRMQKRENVAWTSLILADREQSDYNGNDDADLNTLLSSITDCDITILFVEQKDNHIKVSWRSKPGFDVSEIAFHFNGGGHLAASGADIPGSLESVMEMVLQQTFAYLQTKKRLQ